MQETAKRLRRRWPLHLIGVDDPAGRRDIAGLEASLRGHLAAIRSRVGLRRDPMYRAAGARIRRCLDGFAWDLTICSDRRPARDDRVRALAWNVERGKRFEPLLGVLRDHPELRNADLLLLCEVDVGMGRSANRDVPRELATALGYNYVFVNYHVVLAPGDRGEQAHDTANARGLHGAALLTRFPVRRAAAVALPEYTDKFLSVEKRLGTKRALMCEVELPDGPLTVVVVHLDPFAPPRHRARQTRHVMAALKRFGGDRVLLGGDLNTNTYDLGSGIGLGINVVHKLVRFGFSGTVRQYMTPEHVFERQTFSALRDNGLRVEPFVDPNAGSIYYDLTDPELVDKSLGYLPRPVYRWLERRLEPWGGRVPLRIDYFAGRGVRPLRATTIDRPEHRGQRVSDHNPIVVDLALAKVDASSGGKSAL